MLFFRLVFLFGPQNQTSFLDQVEEQPSGRGLQLELVGPNESAPKEEMVQTNPIRVQATFGKARVQLL